MSSSIILNDCFSARNLTENELVQLNSLLFNKVATLKNKIIQLENQLKNKHKDNKDDFDDFEIIDLQAINEFNMGLFNVQSTFSG